ncbi:MAG: hypothetical protein HC799_03445 [Limnothrix sp. RL_2_0]|nr:hypothetical protein [Limnothrix sp. RL_2_0]
MKRNLHYRHWLKVGIVSLEMLGFTAAVAFAQTPPDVVIESDSSGGTGSGDVVVDGDRRFVCQLDQGNYTVMYRPESQPGEAYAWAVPQGMGGGWTAQRRCDEISRRLESYRSDGLVELTTGTENNYDVVCVTTEANNACQIVFTVPPGQNAIRTRDDVFSNLASADDGIQTQGVNTFTGNSSQNSGLLGQIQGIFGGNRPMTAPQSGYGRSGINLKPFLDQSDGGTLGRNSDRQSAPARILNPDLFR